MFSLKNLTITSRILWPVGLMLVLVLGGLTMLVQNRSTEAIRSVAEKELSALSLAHGNAVRAYIGAALNASTTLRDAFVSLKIDGIIPPRNAVISMLRGVADSNDNFIALAALWEPNAYDGEDAKYINGVGSDANGRFAPYTATDEDLTVIEADVLARSNFYTEPKRRLQAYLTAPYEYMVGGKSVLMTTAAVPVVMDNAFKGVVCTDMGLSEIVSRVQNIKIYEEGYGYLVTSDGTIIAHRNTDRIGDTRVFEESPNAASLKRAIANGETFLDMRERNDGTFIYYYTPIQFNGVQEPWYLVTVASQAEVLSQAYELRNIVLMISGCALAAMLLMLYFMVRFSLRPVEYMANAAETIAAGNLQFEIRDEHFGGEMRKLSQAIKTMIASLVKTIGEANDMSEDAKNQAARAHEAMQEAEQASAEAQDKTESMLVAADKLEGVVNVLSSASTQLSAQIEQSERGASEQAARITETATAVEEMNSTVLEVARNAGAAAEVSANTKARAEEGAGVVQGCIAAIDKVQHDSLSLKNDMNELVNHAQNITQIMGVISDIADQTNLLALNAAIEAARAGDAGRGFAVVADEVRKLAEKTMHSTSDVGNAIRAIQQSVNASREQVDATVRNVETATEFAGKCGDVLHQIVQMAEETADQVRAIATASEQQSASSEEISQSISQVNVIAGETAQAMEESARAVSDLADQSQLLGNLIEDMKKN